ncbi:hypothetical protein LINPERPRIM_LOCUS21910, partial [Linum perenne]
MGEDKRSNEIGGTARRRQSQRGGRKATCKGRRQRRRGEGARRRPGAM